jgi:hypothetical protein
MQKPGDNLGFLHFASPQPLSFRRGAGGGLNQGIEFLQFT